MLTGFVLLSSFSFTKTIYMRVSTKSLPDDAKCPLPVEDCQLSQVTLVNFVVFFLLFSCTEHSCSLLFFWQKLHIFLVFTTSSEDSRTSLIFIKIQFWPLHTSQWLTWQTPVLNVTQLQHWELDCLFAAAEHFPDFFNKQRFLIYKLLTCRCSQASWQDPLAKSSFTSLDRPFQRQGT